MPPGANPHGTLDERCAWMRWRQQQRSDAAKQRSDALRRVGILKPKHHEVMKEWRSKRREEWEFIRGIQRTNRFNTPAAEE